jgi:hypothetical protein
MHKSYKNAGLDAARDEELNMNLYAWPNVSGQYYNCIVRERETSLLE